MLKIGDFSRLSRISIRMLRHYDELSLLIPKTIDDFGMRVIMRMVADEVVQFQVIYI